MLKSERTKFIMDFLEQTYPNTPVPLNNKNVFELLIAVLLSAQCTDERVNKVTPSLFKIADNPFDMEKIPVEKIYEIIRPCGLAPQKSKAISNLSKILVNKFDGMVPKDINELEKLPGVGHKTASVVVSQGFGIPAFPVDTHIHRLAQRWCLTIGKNVKISRFDIRGLGKAHADRTIEGFVKIVSNAEDDSILGMHIVSSHAADLVHEGVAAIKGGIKTGELGSMIHSHPTLSEGIMFAALS